MCNLMCNLMEKSMRSKLPRNCSRSHSLYLAACMATLCASGAQADDSAAIARIEASLRPPVALAGARPSRWPARRSRPRRCRLK